MACEISHDHTAKFTGNMYNERFGVQKLLVTIDSSQRERVREYQRRCEEALTDILLKGAAPPVGCPSNTLCLSLAHLFTL